MAKQYRFSALDTLASSSVPQAPQWEVSLEIVRGRARNVQRRIRSTAYLIGSASDCDLVLGDERFADVHACLLVRGDGVWFRHLGFSPESTVNGAKVSRILLADGDRIRTGPFEFLVRIRHRSERLPTDEPTANETASAHFLRIHPATIDADALRLATTLLADIRKALQPNDPGVNLYIESERAHKRAPVLPATWMTTVRRARGA